MSKLGRMRGRGAQAWRVLRRSGPRGLATRAVRLAFRRLDAAEADFPLLASEIVDSTALHTSPPPAHPYSDELTIGWITTPPAAGSGGHTTMFRFVQALEAAGHTCVLYLYDRYDGDLRHHTDVIRSWWPGVRAEVRDIRHGLGAADAHVATSWPTAHVLASRSSVPGARFYLVQDYEPYFYGRGSLYALAEETYRFGYHCISVGHMVADALANCFGIACDVAEFGCDTDVYQLTNAGPRNGVVFYAKPGAERRGYELGVLALAELQRRRPDVPIHVFGSHARHLPFPAVRHDRMTPRALSDLYNTCAAGLALSFTNVSLTAAELLACGVVPVINDSTFNRADLESTVIRWARPTPQGLADALDEVLAGPDRSAEAAASVAGISWDKACATVVDAIERTVRGAM